MDVRKSDERRFADHGWLRSYHSFSFAAYHDPAHMGWGNLRVLNDDLIAPDMGFAMHGHRDMEIISYVVEGALAHKDSLGNVTTIPAGDVQRMSAGRGVMHSEFNPASDARARLLQIWIEPLQRGIDPGYEQRTFAPSEKRGRLCLVASPDGAHGSMTVHADASLYAALIDGKESATLTLDPIRKVYVHVVRGALSANGQRLMAGDAAKLTGESCLTLGNGEDAEVLVFDLAP